MPMLCYCGHDCTRCKTYIATATDDAALRAEVAAFYRATFGRDIPPEDIRCMGGRSGDVFFLCDACPWMACCKEKGLERCADCADYPCAPLEVYQAKFVNRANIL